MNSLVRSPLRRTLAVVLTVAMGTGSLFILHGFNHGVMNQYRDNTIHCRYGYGQVNVKGYREQVFEKPWEHWIENPDVVIASLRKAPGVTQVFPRIDFGAMLTNGSINVSGRGQGIDGREEAGFFNTLNIEEGVTLSTQANGILLGRGLARALKAKPGDHITMLSTTVDGSFNGADMEVVGIFHTGQKDFDDVVFRVPLAQAQGLLSTTKVESIALGLDGVDSWDGFAKYVAHAHPELETTSFAVLDKVYYQNAVDWLASQFDVIQFIILTVVILGIFNTVSTSVLERKQEIGNLRANGDSKTEVVSLLCAENAVLGMTGGIVGILFVLALIHTVLAKGFLMPPSPGITRQFHVIIEVSALMALKTFLMGTVSCFVGALLAAIRIARMPIADALRSH
ncbi:MAG: FtsX-like permease family protein [Bdellovibrionota bacterium]